MMCRGVSLPAGLLALIAIAQPGRAHEEWHHLHIVYSAKTSFTYPFDGRSPKIAVALLNHHPTPAPATVFTFSVNGQRMDGGGFMTFPNGGPINVDPDNLGLASALTSGVYDGRSGPAPAVGETKAYAIEFLFALAPGAVPPPASTTSTNPDPSNNGDPPGTTRATVRFTNLGDNPALDGPFPCTGTVRLAAPTGAPAPANVRMEIATPYSNWFPLTLSGSGTTYSFNHSLLARDDWHLRFTADGYESKVLALGFINDPHPPLAITLAPSPAPDIQYQRAAAIATPTGFWRGAVSEIEGTFVAFPGQETWRDTATQAEARALRSASRIYKCRFDGTRVWEHAPGWETWGGDMTPDGRFVVYVLNPTVHPFYTPTEHKLVLLDGLTGTPLWTKSAAPTDAVIGRKLDSLELAFSPDARWIAVGSVGTGAVTLVDRTTGNFAWTVPGAPPASFGQIRKLRFSPDAQFLYCGSGDSNVRKLRVSDGAVLWKIFAGGWPDTNGLDLTPDGAWLVAGTRSLDATLIRTSDGFMQWQRETQHPDAVMAPDGGHVVTAGGQIYRSLDGSLAGMTKVAGVARFTGDSRHLIQLSDPVPRVFDRAGKLLTGALSPIPVDRPRPRWAYLSHDGGTAILLGRDSPVTLEDSIVIFRRSSAPATAAPAIVAQPLAQTIATGSVATLTVTATGAGPLHYQWRKNGVAVSGEAGVAGPALIIANATPADAGAYSCVVTNAAGTATTHAIALEVAPADPANPGRLTNLAVRANVGATPLIVGFSVGGAGTSGTKPLLIRGAGPSLTGLGVTDALLDPRLAVYQGTTEVAENRDWAGNADVSALAVRVGAFPFAASTSRDAALAATTVGGSYTAQLASSDSTSGTALAEIYDASTSFNLVTPRLVNVSARTDVGGANLLIAGFVISGGTARTVLVRGIGPALAGFGIRDALIDVQLSLFRDGVLVASNDDWYDAPNAVAIATVARNVGAFSLAPTSRDAALLLSLPPGNYTAQVTSTPSAAPATGNALVEVYEVP